MADDPSAHVNCEKLLQALRRSNLNFFINESPYSVQICIRKRFINETQRIPNPQTFGVEGSDFYLKEKLAKYEAECDTFKSESSALQEKLAKAECDLYKISNNAKENRENLIDEVKTFKNALCKSNEDTAKLRSDVSSAKKSNKLKEKEIYNLSRKNENLEESIKNLKEEKFKLKSEKAKIESKMKKSQKIKSRTTNKSQSVQTENLSSAEAANDTSKTSLSSKSLAPTSATSLSMPLDLSNTSTNSLSSFTMSLPPTASTPLTPPYTPSAGLPSVSSEPPWTSTSSPARTSSVVPSTTSKSLSSESTPSSTIELTQEEKIARFDAEKKEALKFMDDIPEEEMIFYHNDVLIFGMDWQEHAQILELYR